MDSDKGDWTCNANTAIELSLVRPGNNNALQQLPPFYPTFTYPIFGEEEEIFGYKNLSVQIRFAAHDLKPNVQINYDHKFKTVRDVAAVDVKKELAKWITSDAFTNKAAYEKNILDDSSAKDFHPPGKLVRTYGVKGKKFEVWAGSLSDPAVKAIIDRIQIFISFYIEGGVPLSTDDVKWTLDRWTVFFVYEKTTQVPSPAASPYILSGYCTTYRPWTYVRRSDTISKPTISSAAFPFPEVSLAELPSRLRISQFLILPNHQGSGHGTFLYDTIRNYALTNPIIHELTVEDPNEEFDTLRDINDYLFLKPSFLANNITINPSPFPPEASRRIKKLPTARLIPRDIVSNLKQTNKIAPRQFNRILEMFLLSQIPAQHRGTSEGIRPILLTQKHRASSEHDRRYYWWRALVKQRVFKQHREIMLQLDREERIARLDETLANIEGEYVGLLATFAIQEKRGWGESRKYDEGENDEEATESEVVTSRIKRKRIIDDDDQSGGEETKEGIKKSGDDSDVEFIQSSNALIDLTGFDGSSDQRDDDEPAAKKPRSD